jgi:hypothetical protein
MFLNLSSFVKPFVLIGIYFIISWLTYFFVALQFSTDNILIELLCSFALVWNLMLVGFFLYQTYKNIRLPQAYYRKKSFESHQLYESLGIRFFQYCLVNSFFRYLNPRVYLKNRGRHYLEIYFEETKQSETSHIFSGIVTLGIQIYLFINGEWISAISLTIFSVIFNLYPFFLQRYNRLSLNRIFDK